MKYIYFFIDIIVILCYIMLYCLIYHIWFNYFAASVTTSYNARKTTTDQSGSNYAYAEYDYGTSKPNDDAYCLGKAVNGTNAKTIKRIGIGRNSGKTSEVNGSSKSSGAYYLVAQISGEDYFKSGSVASATTGGYSAKVTVK